MREILIPVCLVLLGLALLGSEALVPSAGILGVLAAASLFAGIVTAFYYNGLMWGTMFLVVTIALVTGLIMKMIQHWPKTAVGKRILGEPLKQEDVFVDHSETEGMVGRVGKTLGLMMPGGMIEIEGKRFDAVAEKAIEANTWVQVSKITTGRILHVQEISAEAALNSSKAKQKASDPLSAEVDDTLEDPFAEPLG